MIKAKAAFSEGLLFSCQSGIFENFLGCSDWLHKSQPSKKATFILVSSNILYIYMGFNL